VSVISASASSGIVFISECAGVTSCQNGGQMEGCACKCEGAWIGGDCGGSYLHLAPRTSTY